MSSASPWADYLDARLRLVRKWADEGHSPVAIALRLAPGAVDVIKMLETPTEPPIPGCSRDLARTWRDRAERYRSELDARGADVTTLPPDHPLHSQIQALGMRENPDECGCQYWVERPRPGEHHPGCDYFPKPESGP